MNKSKFTPALEGEALEAKRRELTNIESRIKAIVGPDPVQFFHKRPSHSESFQIQELLWDRKECLNAMFLGTPEEFERLANFNTNLVDMNEELERRADELKRFDFSINPIIHTMPNESESKDVVVKGIVINMSEDHDSRAALDRGIVPYNHPYTHISCAIHPDIDHIAVLDDDPIYCSDFAYMCRLNYLNGRFGELTKSQYLATCLDCPFDLDILMDLDPLYSPLDSLLDAQPALSKLWQQTLVQRLGLNYPINLAIIISNYSILDLIRIERLAIEIEYSTRDFPSLSTHGDKNK